MTYLLIISKYTYLELLRFDIHCAGYSIH